MGNNWRCIALVAGWSSIGTAHLGYRTPYDFARAWSAPAEWLIGALRPERKLRPPRKMRPSS
jgi:hypothetical protein